MIIDNPWYGHRRELLSYIGVEDQPVFAFIAHSTHTIWDVPSYKYEGRLAAFYPILVWNEFDEKNMRRLGANTVVATGAPFLYALKNIELSLGKSSQYKRRGTIVFPQHLVPGERWGLKDIEKIIGIVKETESNTPPPYRLSLPLFDPRSQSRLTHIIGNRWTIHSFGSRNSHDFLRQYIRTVGECEFAVVESSSSSAYYYALYLGLKVHILHNKSIIESNVDNTYGLPRTPKKDIAHLVDKSTLTLDEGKHLSGVVLGESSLKSQSEMRHILGVSSTTRNIAAQIYRRFSRLRYSAKSMKGLDDHGIIKKVKESKK